MAKINETIGDIASRMNNAQVVSLLEFAKAQDAAGNADANALMSAIMEAAPDAPAEPSAPQE